MSKTPNHEADIQNGNSGTPGTTTTWDKAQGNRGKQLNPNQQPGAAQSSQPGQVQGGDKTSTK